MPDEYSNFCAVMCGVLIATNIWDRPQQIFKNIIFRIFHIMKHGLAKLCVLMSSNDKKNLHVDYFEKRYEQANEKVDKIGHFFTVRLYPYLSFPTCVIGIYFMYKGYSSELGEKNLYLLLAPATVLAYYVIAYFIAVIFLFVECLSTLCHVHVDNIMSNETVKAQVKNEAEQHQCDPISSSE